ncbi:AAA family ATPase [Pectobacterium aquaticum]|uniref:AAA family ATPase n=1 Tax=Pectobacterium aquaticum TaxID=2204145 RepID=UPI000E23098B|nr:AAA family ATPase [Pectobacterium aquaticum]RRN97143.1 ABC transporter ATP-binding protein [Pectobacterium aquaticum]
MKIKINNFGTISDADVHIGGLTVITGENDTGKSTIGKVAFSLVKAISRYEEGLEEEKEDKINSIVDRIYFNLRRSVSIVANPRLRELFTPRKFFTQIKIDTYKTINERREFIDSLKENGVISYLLHQASHEDLNKIIDILEESEDEISSINKALRKGFYSEFKGEIIQKGHESPVKASLEVTDGVSELIDLKWTRDGIYHFVYSDSLGYADATYVDSPSAVQFHNLVQFAKTLYDNTSEPGRPTVPFHLKDLSAKLSDSAYSLFEHSDLFPEGTFLYDSVLISKKISLALGGEVVFDHEASDFFLEKHGFRISSGNIASGIKSLGILDMLIKGGSVQPNSLLIIDEPEVNLHPKWQVLYCELICDLVRLGVDIIITTHSPYVLDALKHYSEKNGIENSFYLTERFPNEPYTYFLDITKNVSHAISLLAAPLRDLNQEYLNDF